MKIGVVAEITPRERRVALVPEIVSKFVKQGFEVVVEAGAGAHARFTDDDFKNAGADVLPGADAVLAAADVLFKVRPPTTRPDGKHEADLIKEGALLVGFVWPALNAELMTKLAARKVSVAAMESVPRISRAQSMDALSSGSLVSGYRAVIEAVHHFGGFTAGQSTAAGRIKPAKVFVVGAGVAGLAAIGTAKNLGAIVSAIDTRSAAADQVRSMGGRFLEPKVKEEGEAAGGYAKEMSEAYKAAQRDLTAEQVRESDIVITTALIPGRPAPKIISAEMVKAMRPGSVIVDLAAEQGGNCELTVPNEVVERHGVTIVGDANLVSQAPAVSSRLYAQNLLNLSTVLFKDTTPQLESSDDIVRGCLIMRAGERLTPPPPPNLAPKAATPAAAAPTVDAKPATGPVLRFGGIDIVLPAGFVRYAVTALALLLLGLVLPPKLQEQLTVFALSVVIGYYVVWNVTPALHTPLMSVTNAISGIIIIGALPLIPGSSWDAARWLAVPAIILAFLNVTGGFFVTHRMLKMFRK